MARAAWPGLGVGGLVDEIEGAEALRVGVFEVFELALEEDVFLGEVAEDEGDAGLVGGVFEDGARELVHPGLKGKGSAWGWDRDAGLREKLG